MSSALSFKSALIALLLIPVIGIAAEKNVELTKPVAPPVSLKQDAIFGYQLMTASERTEYRAKMLNAKTPEERQKIRIEHHNLMLERAKAKGVTLPETPMMNGQGKGMGRQMRMRQGQ
nr:hypothetical protein [uncultured Tolumonas sp.]